MAGPFFVELRPGVLVHTRGNFYGPGRPGSGPKAILGIVLSPTSIQITFSQCVNITAVTGIEYRIDGGAWTGVTGRTGSDTTWQFTVAGIDPGEDVDWRYVGGSGTIVDCGDAEDIGDQFVNVHNPLVLEGDFWLLETGGTDIFLLEDDTDGSAGWKLENAT